VLVRTWNLFHGNTVPPGRRAYLRQMVELVTADDPDVVCLQEIPVWALDHLEDWSGLRAVPAVARRPRAPFGRWVTELHHGLLRSAVTGEGGAILVARRFEIDDARSAVMSHGGLRRVAQRVRLDGSLVVTNFHISGVAEQLERVGAFIADAPQVVAAGDANIRGARLTGFSAPLADSIDQILVRGLRSTPPTAWPAERRRVDDRLLSDHAPVELRVE
jgi:endonuclease/exonuclease/phosphatase family metal-dependent hydrolase